MGKEGQKHGQKPDRNRRKPCQSSPDPVLASPGGRVGLRWCAVGLCEDEATLKLIFNSSVKDLLLNDRIMRMMGS